MNGLDAKKLLIGSLKIDQQNFLKIFVLVVLFAFNFRLGLQLQASETVLAPQPTLNKQSFVSKALKISGDAVVTIETERKIVSSREGVLGRSVNNITGQFFTDVFLIKKAEEKRGRKRSTKVIVFISPI